MNFLFGWVLAEKIVEKKKKQEKAEHFGNGKYANGCSMQSMILLWIDSIWPLISCTVATKYYM